MLAEIRSKIRDYRRLNLKPKYLVMSKNKYEELLVEIQSITQFNEALGPVSLLTLDIVICNIENLEVVGDAETEVFLK